VISVTQPIFLFGFGGVALRLQRAANGDTHRASVACKIDFWVCHF